MHLPLYIFHHPSLQYHIALSSLYSFRQRESSHSQRGSKFEEEVDIKDADYNFRGAAGTIFPSVIDMTKLIEKAVQVGDSLNVPCLLETPGGSIQWIRNGKPLVLNNSAINKKYWNITTDNEVSLTISDTTAEDNGLWECREVGSDGVMIRTTKVLKLLVMRTVSLKPYKRKERIRKNKQHLLKASSEINAEIHEFFVSVTKWFQESGLYGEVVAKVVILKVNMVTKLCKISKAVREFSYREVTVRRYNLNGNNLNSVSKERDLSVTVDQSLKPSKHYAVASGSGNPPDDPFLEIEEKKLPSQATISVKELTLLSVKCVARHAVPPVEQIHWSLDTKNISSNSELLVEFLPEKNTYVSWSVVTFNVTRTFHKKDLVCYVHHELWPQAVTVSASLDVLYVPSFSISREPPFGFPVVEGMFVSLQCDIDANPPSVAKWLKDEGTLPLASSVDGVLNFTSISRHHSGWYKCITENQFGSFSSFGYFLNVRYGAEIVQEPPDVLEADAGDPFRLECKADGKPPPSYCWTRIRENSRLEGVSIEKDLLLDTVLYSDAGQYKCIASNTIGRRLYTAQTKDINVKVKR
ncbi:uncharacterized protein LOC143227394 [Tachypleus tridentatus]|uniref:uncharacterized protein LOC143227394 n=1 Tax=Tachypleus tridentatus TaxID=6853 RepID=UPI003FCF3CCC